MCCCVQADLAGHAVSKAQQCGGSVRLISRSDEDQDAASVDAVLRDIHGNRATTSADEMSGFVQARFASVHRSTGLHRKKTGCRRLRVRKMSLYSCSSFAKWRPIFKILLHLVTRQ